MQAIFIIFSSTNISTMTLNLEISTSISNNTVLSLKQMLYIHYRIQFKKD